MSEAEKVMLFLALITLAACNYCIGDFTGDYMAHDKICGELKLYHPEIKLYNCGGK